MEETETVPLNHASHDAGATLLNPALRDAQRIIDEWVAGNTSSELNLSNLELTELPSLPFNLKWLNCSNNQLTSLSLLPSTLIILNCNNNQLTSLPPLQQSLKSLYCSSNQLTKLPELPQKLTTLFCDDNRLTELPTLPHSLSIMCRTGNPIQYPPPEINRSLDTIRTWMSKNPLNLLKSADKR